MEKPATVLIAEFRNNIVKDIQNSNLPLWKIRDELEFFLLPKVRETAIKEEQIERQQYEEYLKEQEELENLRKERVEIGGNKNEKGNNTDNND